MDRASQFYSIEYPSFKVSSLGVLEINGIASGDTQDHMRPLFDPDNKINLANFYTFDKPNPSCMSNVQSGGENFMISLKLRLRYIMFWVINLL